MHQRAGTSGEAQLRGESKVRELLLLLFNCLFQIKTRIKADRLKVVAFLEDSVSNAGNVSTILLQQSEALIYRGSHLYLYCNPNAYDEVGEAKFLPVDLYNKSRGEWLLRRRLSRPLYRYVPVQYLSSNIGTQPCQVLSRSNAWSHTERALMGRATMQVEVLSSSPTLECTRSTASTCGASYLDLVEMSLGPWGRPGKALGKPGGYKKHTEHFLFQGEVRAS